MNKHYSSFSSKQFFSFIFKFIFFPFFLSFTYASVSAQTSYTLSPAADAFVRNGTYAAYNYGSDTALIIKGSASSGYTRSSFLKFSLGNVSTITSAMLRIYGRNTDNTSSVSFSCYSVDNDSWTESGITWNNAPPSSTTALNSAAVNNQAKYYELDVTDYVKSQAAGDKVVSFLIKDPSNQNNNLAFNSKENSKNPPQLVISTSATVASPGNALLFVENPDKFPSNDHFVFSRIQVPWTRDSVYAANHDSVRVRINSKGINTLIVNDLVLSSSSRWKIDNINGVKYVAGSGLPLKINSGTYKDVIIKFVAVDQATTIKIVNDSLTILSNDDKFPSKTILLSGLLQKQGEGLNEPSAQEIINTFGFKTNTGFDQTDPDQGDSAKLKGDEILPRYFVRADNSRPVSVIQIAAYHGCCNTAPEKIMWYAKGSASSLNTLFTHVLVDGQTLLPRKSKPNTPADAVFTPSGAFGLKVGAVDYLDPKLNPSGKTGIKVWKALDANGNIIPNSYILGEDSLATSANYSYQDNMYFIKNVKPENGTAFYSTLSATPSALDFGEKITQTDNSLTLNLNSLGKTYADGSKDPSIIISSMAIAGENKSEFSAAMPLKTILNPQEKTTLTVNFKPASQGLKIADLLIYYNNSQSPLRVPLYGIAKASGTTVTATYRINSGAKTAITLNGKTWVSDTSYVIGSMQPYTSKLTQIAGTDEDPLYFKEQHSDSAKKPWSYEFPVANGDYVVRLHFAEIFWGVPGSGLDGGAGSRVMSVALEGQLRIVNFDPTQEVGASATAIIKNLPVTVSDGKLTINFTSTADRPMVCAVEVYSFSTASNRPAIIFAENNSDKAKAYPNPLQKTLKIQFPAKYAGDYYLQMVDIMGRVYEIGKMKLPQGGSNMQIDISKFSLKPGFYYLEILSENAKPELIKLIVR